MCLCGYFSSNMAAIQKTIFIIFLLTPLVWTTHIPKRAMTRGHWISITTSFWDCISKLAVIPEETSFPIFIYMVPYNLGHSSVCIRQYVYMYRNIPAWLWVLLHMCHVAYLWIYEAMCLLHMCHVAYMWIYEAMCLLHMCHVAYMRIYEAIFSNLLHVSVHVFSKCQSVSLVLSSCFHIFKTTAFLPPTVQYSDVHMPFLCLSNKLSVHLVLQILWNNTGKLWSQILPHLG